MKPTGGDVIREAMATAQEFVPPDGGTNKRAEILSNKPLNDKGNAERMRARYGRDLLFTPELGRLSWTGTHWSARNGERDWQIAAFKTLEHMRDEADAWCAAHAGDNKAIARFLDWVRNSGNTGHHEGMQKLAQPYLQKRVEELDTDPFLFNVQNGTLELGTKGDPAEVRLRRHSRVDLITRISPTGYDENATCYKFREFLNQVMPDQEIQGWLQRWFGYLLTADYSEHCLAAFWGEGRNGKGTLIKLFQWLLGDYAATISFASLLDDRNRNGSAPSPDLAKLAGKRAVFAGEPKKGARLDDGRIKEITGGDTLTVRNLNLPFFDLQPTFKLTLAFNNKPRIADDTHGMWSRMRLIPFGVIFPDERQDKQLLDKLMLEGPGILNWALDGFRMWRERGLSPPQAIIAATREYRTESDRIGAFLAAATVPKDGATIQSSHLYACYQGWCRAAEHRPVSLHLFGEI